MKCKKHPIDLSSSVGVCAPCLREKLVLIIAAQSEAQALKQAQHHQPPPVSFPRSVSPYISRRNAETTAATWQPRGHHHRFYSTPPVWPNSSITVEIEKNKKSKRGKFSSLFLGFFRSKPENKPDLESNPVSDPAVLIDSCSDSPAWFSNIIPGRRKKKISTFSIEESTNRGRGMSPTRHADNEDEHCYGGSSGYSSDSHGWKQTPRRTPVTTRRGGGRVSGHSKSISGFAFCLSPMVRASPNRNCNPRGVLPEMVVAGESRVKPKPKPHLNTAAPFCKNRSRKFADFGRQTYYPTY